MTKNSLCRMCIATRVIKSVDELFRIVKTPNDDIVIEENVHIPGRGAYISRNIDAIKTAQKRKLLSRALKCEVKEEIYEQLLAKC